MDVDPQRPAEETEEPEQAGCLGSPGPGRPLDEARTRSILRAAYRLLVEEGLEALTTVKLARRAGVSTATLYRRWPSKEAIVMDGYLDAVEPLVKFPPAPTALASLRAQLGNVAEAAAGADGALLASLIACAQRCPEVRAALLERFVGPRRAAVRQVLQRAVDEGELRPDVDFELLLDALHGPIYFRLLVGHARLTRAAIEAHFDLLMSGARVR